MTNDPMTLQNGLPSGNAQAKLPSTSTVIHNGLTDGPISVHLKPQSTVDQAPVKRQRGNGASVQIETPLLPFDFVTNFSESVTSNDPVSRAAELAPEFNENSTFQDAQVVFHDDQIETGDGSGRKESASRRSSANATLQ